MPDNRSVILHTALNLFAAHGYDAVGVQQIVAEAGVTKPTLYYYFQSKLGLFESIVEEKAVGLILGLREACDYQHDVTLSITRVTQFYFDFQQENPAFYRLMLVTSFVPPSSEIFQSVSALHAKQYGLLEKMFLEAVPDHGNMRGRHKQYAASLRGMIDTYVGLALQGYMELDDDHTVYRIVHQFMHGIFS